MNVPVRNAKNVVTGIALAVKNVPINKDVKGLHLATVSRRRNVSECLKLWNFAVNGPMIDLRVSRPGLGLDVIF